MKLVYINYSSFDYDEPNDSSITMKEVQEVESERLLDLLHTVLNTLNLRKEQKRTIDVVKNYLPLKEMKELEAVGKLKFNDTKIYCTNSRGELKVLDDENVPDWILTDLNDHSLFFVAIEVPSNIKKQLDKLKKKREELAKKRAESKAKRAVAKAKKILEAHNITS